MLSIVKNMVVDAVVSELSVVLLLKKTQPFFAG
jgi:hypothetical protein